MLIMHFGGELQQESKSPGTIFSSLLLLLLESVGNTFLGFGYSWLPYFPFNLFSIHFFGNGYVLNVTVG